MYVKEQGSAENLNKEIKIFALLSKLKPQITIPTISFVELKNAKYDMFETWNNNLTQYYLYSLTPIAYTSYQNLKNIIIIDFNYEF